MGINLQARHWSFKPPVGTLIDRSNPLSIGLVLAVPLNEIGAPPREILTQKTFSTGTLAWASSTPYGPGQNTNGVQANVLSVLTSDSRLGFTDPPATVCAFGTVASNSQYQLAFGVFDTALDGGGRFGVGITSNNFWFMGCVGGASTIAAPSAGTPSPFFAVVSYDGNNTNFLVNGVTQSVSTGASSPQNVGGIYLGGDNHTAGGPSNPASPWNGVVSGAYAWNRVLSFEEMAQLYASPWAVFNPPGGKVRYFIPPIATGTTLRLRTLMGVGS